MQPIDLYASVGYALELLARSEYHRRHRVGRYLAVEILPALRRRQVRFQLTPDGIPTAMVTWAWLSEAVEREVHETGRALARHEWSCGDRLFFNDWVSPYGNAREVRRDVLEAFGVDGATSLCRNPDGSVRRINRWVRPRAELRRPLPTG